MNPQQWTPRLLLVEDNPGDVRLMQEALQACGQRLHLDVATDGDMALAMLFGDNGYESLLRPDLILLDLNLPRRNGIEVLQTIKQTPELCCTPVLVLSSSESQHDIQAAYRACANGYLVKPVELNDYFSMMERLCSFWFGHARTPRAHNCAE